jgi:hypothetical protein
LLLLLSSRAQQGLDAAATLPQLLLLLRWCIIMIITKEP